MRFLRGCWGFGFCESLEGFGCWILINDRDGGVEGGCDCGGRDGYGFWDVFCVSYGGVGVYYFLWYVGYFGYVEFCVYFVILMLSFVLGCVLLVMGLWRVFFDWIVENWVWLVVLEKVERLIVDVVV